MRMVNGYWDLLEIQASPPVFKLSYGPSATVFRCVDRNFSTVEVDLDAKSVIDVLTSPSCSNNLTLPLVDDCRLLATKIPQIRFNHCYREANRSVDKLARLGAVQDSCFEIFTCPPVDVVRTLN